MLAIFILPIMVHSRTIIIRTVQHTINGRTEAVRRRARQMLRGNSQSHADVNGSRSHLLLPPPPRSFTRRRAPAAARPAPAAFQKPRRSRRRKRPRPWRSAQRACIAFGGCLVNVQHSTFNLKNAVRTGLVSANQEHSCVAACCAGVRSRFTRGSLLPQHKAASTTKKLSPTCAWPCPTAAPCRPAASSVARSCPRTA